MPWAGGSNIRTIASSRRSADSVLADGGRFSKLVSAIVHSDPFQKRGVEGSLCTMKPISRRTILRGLGTAVALPWLEAMAPSIRSGQRGRARCPAADGVLLRPQRRPHAGLDAYGRRNGLPAPRDPPAARPVQGRPPGPDRPDPGRGLRPRRRRRRPRPVARQLPDRHPPAQDGRLRDQGGRLGRPGRRAEGRQGDPVPLDRAGDRPGRSGG